MKKSRRKKTQARQQQGLGMAKEKSEGDGAKGVVRGDIPLPRREESHRSLAPLTFES